MANPHKGEVAFEADGISYVLRFSIDAICQLEELTGKGIVTLIGELQDPEKMSLSLARQVLWAGLQEQQPHIGVKEAGELITAAGGMAKIISLFGTAFTASFPPAQSNSSRPRKAGNPKNGIGPRSTGIGRVSDATTKAFGEKLPAKSS